MSMIETSHSRRRFLKTVGAAGAGTVLAAVAPGTTAAQAAPATDGELTAVPTRPFGKTGINVSILGLGGVLDPSDQIVFRQALKSGVSYWDTADGYGWGRNEKAIGKYFAKYPQDREKVFLVTKAATSDPAELTEKLNTSLQRMNTTYVDMYFIHYVSDVETELTPEVKSWAERMKADGRIRLFGFSAHKNMEASMTAAAKLGWIDGLMVSYNYRLMEKDEMKRAVDACVKAGIGLTAMKTQAAFSANFYASIGSESDHAFEMTDAFLKKGFTEEQAKLKVVWENPHIASICSAMSNMTILQANVAAALNRATLSAGDKQQLNRYAHETAAGYCAGCAGICEPAVAGHVPISDVLRYAMYKNSYGDHDRAAGLFRALPADVRNRLLNTDYAEAERRCPQGIQIGQVLRETSRDLA